MQFTHVLHSWQSVNVQYTIQAQWQFNAHLQTDLLVAQPWLDRPITQADTHVAANLVYATQERSSDLTQGPTNDVIQQVCFSCSHTSTGIHTQMHEVHMQVIIRWVVMNICTQLITSYPILLLDHLHPASSTSAPCKAQALMPQYCIPTPSPDMSGAWHSSAMEDCRLLGPVDSWYPSWAVISVMWVTLLEWGNCLARC